MNSFNDEAQSVVRKLEKRSPDMPSWPLWKPPGPGPSAPEASTLGRGVPSPCPRAAGASAGSQSETGPARPSSASLLLELWAALVLVSENALHSVLLTAGQVPCWLSKKRGGRQKGRRAAPPQHLTPSNGPRGDRTDVKDTLTSRNGKNEMVTKPQIPNCDMTMVFKTGGWGGRGRRETPWASVSTFQSLILGEQDSPPLAPPLSGSTLAAGRRAPEGERTQAAPQLSRRQRGARRSQDRRSRDASPRRLLTRGRPLGPGPTPSPEFGNCTHSASEELRGCTKLRRAPEHRLRSSPSDVRIHLRGGNRPQGRPSGCLRPVNT